MCPYPRAPIKGYYRPQDPEPTLLFDIRIEGMADIEPIVTAIESTVSKKEQLQKAVEELDAHRDSIQNCTIQWKDLEHHFSCIHEALKKRVDELVEKEKSFEAKALETREMLEKRDEAVAVKEQASLARVQEQKDAALAVIIEARSKQMEVSVDASAKTDGVSENKVNDSSVTDIEPIVPTSDKEEKSPAKSGAPKAGVASEVKPRPQLKQLCEKMDAKGLLKFISENRKFLAALRDEVPAALQFATDPARLVLNALEGFYPTNEPSNQGNKKETGLPAQRRTCILLLESLVPSLADPETSSDHPVVASDIKEQAKGIADNWKPKLADLDVDAANGNSLEAQAFLQLLATFGIASEYDEEELCKLVLAVSRRRQTPELCLSLGLAAKMPGIVEILVNSGKQIEAVNFSHAFGLVDKFPPVPLLKAYLKDAKKVSQGKSGISQNEVIAKELSALRAVIKCIEEHKLGSEYPIEGLQKRVAQLEKEKADKKRSADAVKNQSKRPRSNSGGGYLPPPTGIERSGGYASANAVDRSFYRPADRVPYPTAAVGHTAYNLPGQSSYERPSQTMYGTSPVPRSYMYSGENMGSSGLGSGSYNSASSYNGYHLGSGLPPTYPSSYLQ